MSRWPCVPKPAPGFTRSSLITRRLRKPMFRGSKYSPNENVWRLSSQPQSVWPRSAAGRIVITPSSPSFPLATYGPKRYDRPRSTGSPIMALAVGSRLGPYEIEAPLGAGGMGEVYRARDGRLDRAVAVKVLPEGFAHDAGRRARFERRGEGRRGPLSPEHPVDPRLRRARRHRLRRDGASRGRNAAPAARGRRPAPLGRPSSTRRRSRAASPPPTTRASSTATSSRRTCSSPRRGG